MIVCKSCGNRNEDGEEFCSSCGRYLAWSGEHVELAPERVDDAPEAAPEESPFVPTRVDRVLAAVRVRSIDAAAARRRRREAELAPPPALVRMPARPVAFEPTRREPDTIVQARANRDATTAALATEDFAIEPDRAAIEALVAEQRAADSSLDPAPDEEKLEEEEEGAEKGLALRKPTDIAKARQRRRAPVAPTWAEDLVLTPSPDDVYCLECNQFNSPERVFCRRCGAELPRIEEPVDEVTYTPLRWWQFYLRRDRPVVYAGGRPGRWGRASSGGGASGRRMAIIARIGAGVIAIGMVISFVGPYSQPIRNWYTSVYHSFIKKVDVTYTQQFAIGANATEQMPAHPAGDAVDDADNTYWQSTPSRRYNGIGQILTIVFASPTTIDRIGFLSGAGPSQQAFLQEARPKEVLISFNNRPGTREILQDTHNFQHLDVHGVNVTSMKVKILSVYPSPVGHAVAITEIEFFQRS